MREQRSLLLVDAGGESMQQLSLRLRQMGFHVLRTKTAEQAATALTDTRFVIGSIVVPPDLPAYDLDLALAAFRSMEASRALPLLTAGRRPDADRRARLRRAGVEQALWHPLDDNTLRFQVNRALAGAGPPPAMRRAERVPTNWPVQIRSGDRRKQAKVYSVSSTGAYLATSRPSMLRAVVETVLPLPACDVPLAGEVVMTNVPCNLLRRNLPIGMGIRFTDQSDEAEHQIMEWAHERASWLRV